MTRTAEPRPVPRRGGARGSALVLALAIVALAAALVAAVTVRVTRAAQAEGRRQQAAAAFNAAEAGLAEAVQEILASRPGFVARRPVGEVAMVDVEERLLESTGLERLVALEATGRCRGTTERLVLVVLVRIDPDGERGPSVVRAGWSRLPRRVR